MCLCFVCSGDPVDGDPREEHGDKFGVSMMQAPAADPLCCVGSCLCPCCAQVYIRRKALGFDMTKYSCCQGYMDGLVPCLQAGECGEARCPNCCLCIEAFLCNGCAVSSTRMMVMDRFNLRPDEWDNRIIRFNNCVQIAAVVCDCLSLCIPGADNLAETVRCIAQCTYATTQGCMTAQVNVELKAHDDSFSPIEDEEMARV